MAELDPENERVRGYLQSQAAKNSLDEIRGKVQEQVAALKLAMLAFGADECAAIPPGETWSPLDCLAHLVAYDLAVARRVLYVALTGEIPPDEDFPLPADREALLDAYSAGLDSLYIHLADAEPAYFLETKWEHEMFGELNWREWFLFLRLHCMDHTRQLEAMRSALP